MSSKLPYVDAVALLIKYTPIGANVLAALTHCQVVGTTERSWRGSTCRCLEPELACRFGAIGS